jgi:hypothetical protein
MQVSEGARIGLLVIASLAAAVPASAEWQIKPFGGVTGGGSTTFIDLEKAAGNAKLVLGVNGSWLTDIVGIEADLGRTPGFFEKGQKLVVASSVTTLTGNLVVTLPRKWTEYTLRPYVVGGAGLLHVHIDDALGALRVASDLPGMDVGGGATGFLSKHVGLNWDVRYFKSIGGTTTTGVSFLPEQLSFWRGTMAVVIRY